MDLTKELVEIKLPADENFLKVKETLTRIGVPSEKNKTLTQSCHILHKRKRYFIVHFKEMFKLDGKEATLTEDDLARRNTIIRLLEQWGLCIIMDPEMVTEPEAKMSSIRVLSFREKREWNLVSKYTIGVR